MYTDISCYCSEISSIYNPLASCKQWGREAHPIDYVTDSDPSTYWLSQAGLPSVDLTFDFTRIYKVSIAYRAREAYIL